MSPLLHLLYCPRKGHLDWVLIVFLYLKKKNYIQIVFGSYHPILVLGVDALDKDCINIFLEFYPDDA